jgi:hypothetical protein
MGREKATIRHLAETRRGCLAPEIVSRAEGSANETGIFTVRQSTVDRTAARLRRFDYLDRGLLGFASEG